MEYVVSDVPQCCEDAPHTGEADTANPHKNTPPLTDQPYTDNPEALISTESKQEESPHTPLVENPFAVFWSQYPAWRRVAKEKAEAAFNRAVEQSGLDAVMDGLERSLRHWPATSDHGQARFVPHPTTWLNQKRFDDSDDAIAAIFSPKPKQNRQKSAAELRDDRLAQLHARITGTDPNA